MSSCVCSEFTHVCNQHVSYLYGVHIAYVMASVPVRFHTCIQQDAGLAMEMFAVWVCCSRLFLHLKEAQARTDLAAGVAFKS